MSVDVIERPQAVGAISLVVPNRRTWKLHAFGANGATEFTLTIQLNGAQVIYVVSQTMEAAPGNNYIAAAIGATPGISDQQIAEYSLPDILLPPHAEINLTPNTASSWNAAFVIED